MIFAGKRPNHLGVRDGQLTPCPNTPNCVSSQSSDAVHKIEPLTAIEQATPVQKLMRNAHGSLPAQLVVTISTIQNSLCFEISSK